MQGDGDVISDGAVGSVLVAVPEPSLQFFLCVRKAHEPVRVQAFRPELAVECEEIRKQSGGLFSRRKMKPLSVGLPGREKSRVKWLA